MRYLVKRDLAGDWAVFDVRRQINHAEGLTVEEARETASNLNRENRENVKQFLDDNLLPL